MGRIKTLAKKIAVKGADRVASMSALSPSQLDDIVAKRAIYLEYDRPDDPAGIEKSDRLLAASGIKIYNAHLSELSELYLPAQQYTEEDKAMNSPGHNIRYFKLNKWVSDKKENTLEKLVNVYGVLSNEDCNIALVFNRTVKESIVYLAVSNSTDKSDNKDINSCMNRLEQALKGNFPGSEHDAVNPGVLPIFKDGIDYSVSTISNIPTEKSEKFISQTIEKLLDGSVPESIGQEYSIILLASPIHDIDERKLFLAELYSGLMPYSSWQTNYTFTESDGTSSMAMFGVNAGMSAGIQNSVNSSVGKNTGETISKNTAHGDSIARSDSEQHQITIGDQQSESNTISVTDTNGYNRVYTDAEALGQSTSQAVSQGAVTTLGNSFGGTVNGGASFGKTGGLGISDSVNMNYSQSMSSSLSKSLSNMTQRSKSYSVGSSTSESVGESVARQVGKSIASSAGKTFGTTVGRSISNTLGKAVNTALSVTEGVARGGNLGGTFGANFARASTITVNVGKNEGITQNFVNYNIKHALEMLESQMKRYDQSSALGMWDFAAYVISEDADIANNVAHTYLSLTQGEESYLSQGAINSWRGDLAKEYDEVGESGSAREIIGYLKNLRHPVFFLDPEVTSLNNHYYCYPPVATATTGLTGKELSYSLNFPQHSVAGLPIIECAEFGRSVVRYKEEKASKLLRLGSIYHMNHKENTEVSLDMDALCSHVFITGSTGSGKSNTIYKLLSEARDAGAKYLVIEPAKGEYKNVLGGYSDVNVYGTNPAITELLKLNPFSFPKDIHVLEHIDRIVEIFNVCWPMYAAMPAVLKNAIERAYEDCGWDLTNSSNEYGEDLFPSFNDVAREVRTIIDSSEYDTENKGAYKGSLLTRLQSLTNGINGLIFSRDEISPIDLFDQNVIVDISRVGSNETKSLIMGILILKLQEYRMVSSDEMNSKLKHITVLEEAHNILKKTSTEQPIDGANLVGKSVEMISNAIAEMRTYGEGFIIADQAPGLLDMAAIRNTNTKIIMRLPDITDRELVGRAANLDDDQITELAKLSEGVAAIYQNKWVQPVLCQIDEFKNHSKGFTYNPDSTLPEDHFVNERIQIAELLSSGTTVSRDRIMGDIRTQMNSMHLEASIQVAICRMLNKPAKEPRMTKLAPIFTALFPEIKKAVKETYSESTEPKEWTQSAEDVLGASYPFEISNQTRRDIIQGIMTDYLLNEKNNCAALKKWSEIGGLK